MKIQSFTDLNVWREGHYIMNISIIVAIAGSKRVIGRKGGMPWQIPEELKRFKEITTGHPIIMGRKTFESIGRPLPGRTNIVVTRDLEYNPSGVVVLHSLGEAIDQAKKEIGSEEIFIIGGGEIYKQVLPQTDKIYLTYIDKEIEGDTYFPDYSDFKQTSESDWQEHEGTRYKFLELDKS